MLRGRRVARFAQMQRALPRLPDSLVRDGWWLAGEPAEPGRGASVHIFPASISSRTRNAT